MASFHPCPSCGRHVKLSATVCPFCATQLGTTSAPLASVIGLVIGLSVAACGDREKDDAGMSESGADTSATEPLGMSNTSTPTSNGSSPTDTDPDQGGEDYGGFGDTDWDPEPWTTDTGHPEPQTDSGESTEGEGSGSSTTGEPSMTDEGGEDYAGPGSEG